MLCSCDPLFLKSLYGVLRQEGYEVDMTEHPADAVRMSFVKDYSAVIMDSGDVGFSAYEAAAAIRSISGRMSVIIAGGTGPSSDSIPVRKPLDLEEVKLVLRSLCGFSDFHERRIQGL